METPTQTRYRWTLRPVEDEAVVASLGAELNNMPEPLARALVLRGIRTFDEAEQFFRGGLDVLHDPFLMKDMDRAARRLVAGVFNGIVVSEDGGRTWSPSSLFQEARFKILRVEIGRHPISGARRLFASGTDSQLSGNQMYASDDDGLTWTNLGTMPESVLFVVVPEISGSAQTLLAVEEGTTDEDSIQVWRSLDGVVWSTAGRLPAVPAPNAIFSEDLLIGPDLYLYVSVSRPGPEHEWVYRSTEPVVVANEAPPEVPEEENSLRVYPNPATDKISVEGVEPGDEVVLYDVLGRAVLRTRNTTDIDIDVSALPPGVYVVRAGGKSLLVTIRR